MYLNHCTYTKPKYFSTLIIKVEADLESNTYRSAVARPSPEAPPVTKPTRPYKQSNLCVKVWYAYQIKGAQKMCMNRL